MRFVCLRVAHLPCLIEDLSDPTLIQRPLVIVRAWDGRVLDALRAADITPGDTRRRVEQHCPDAAILPAHEPLYQTFHQALQTALTAFSQAVEAAGLGEFFIEVGALARTFPSEHALVQQIAKHVEAAVHLPVTLGLAGNKFTAWQAAAGATDQPRIVPPGAERAFLADLPLTALPDPPPEMIRRLHLFGLTTLRDLAALSRAAVAGQFGAEALVFHDLARGLDMRPLQPEAPPPLIRLSRRLPEPLTERPQLLALTERAARRLAERLQASGYQATALTLTLTVGEQPEMTTGAPLKPPTAAVEVLTRISARLLGKLTPETGVTGLSLTAYPLREWQLGAQQLSLVDEMSAPRLARLRETLRLLWRRFGETIIRLASAIGPPLPLPIQVSTRADGQPAALHWGGWSRPVTDIYESWREERRWWEQTVQRAYFQVLVADETPFTIFQDERRRWFLDRRQEL